MNKKNMAVAKPGARGVLPSVEEVEDHHQASLEEYMIDK